MYRKNILFENFDVKIKCKNKRELDPYSKNTFECTYYIGVLMYWKNMLATRDIYYTYILQPRALSFPPSIKSIAAIVIHTHIIYNTHFETCYTRAKAQRYHCEAERIHTLFVPDDSLLFTSASPSMRATYMYEPCKIRSRQSTVKQKKHRPPRVTLSLSTSRKITYSPGYLYNRAHIRTRAP